MPAATYQFPFLQSFYFPFLPTIGGEFILFKFKPILISWVQFHFVIIFLILWYLAFFITVFFLIKDKVNTENQWSSEEILERIIWEILVGHFPNPPWGVPISQISGHSLVADRYSIARKEKDGLQTAKYICGLMREFTKMLAEYMIE